MKKGITFLGLSIFACMVVVVCGMTTKESNEGGSKSLSNAVPKEINHQYPVDKKQAENKKPMVALTFDDGPHPIYTKQLLEILDKYHAKGTFFMVGKNMENNPDLVKLVAKKGHEIGNHTYSHEDLMQLNSTGRENEIMRVQELAHEQIGVYPRWLRPPYGSGDVAILEAETKMDIAFWSVDTRDWESRNTASVYQMFEKSTKEGDIVLFHDIYGTSIEAVEQILKTYSTKYQFVTLSTVYDATNKK